ncbi:MAG TPA: winged helix-turn-helix domain-containing protein [Pyrinomonadaceae bacterium]|nr:winged helix-turn-helix domain-containing protein [Pyrinomonadaceae bacterium]
MKDPAAQSPYLFAEFELDPLRRVLLRGGRPVALNPKAVEVLLAMVERRAEVLSKDELLKAVWPDQIVEENNLTVHVSALRKALGEKRGAHEFIVTIPGCGYRFVADVRRADPADALIVEHHSVTHITVEEDDEDDDTPRAGEAQGVSASPALLEKSSARNATQKRRAVQVGAATTITLFLALGAFFAYKPPDAKKRSNEFERFEIKRQTNTGKVLGAVVSPDGQYLAYAQTGADGQSLWLRHVPTGSGSRIVEPKPVEFWGLTFTPDGHYIYATTFEKSQADPVLTKIPVLGGVTERLPVVTNAGVSFSPDGRRMAYVVSSRSSGGSILWTAGADGSDKKFVALRKDPNSFAMQANTVAWSPDGGTIACAVLNNAGDGLHMSVVGYGVRDGVEKQLTAGRWNFIDGVAWASGNESLLLTGNDRQGVPSQVWFVPAGDGQARRVTNDLNNYHGVSMTSGGGSFVTVQTDTTSGIWTAQLNEDWKANDFRQNFSETGEIPAIGWNPGGELVYLSVASGAPELWLLNAESGRARQLTIDARASDFAVSPDGRYLVVVSNRAGKPNLWRIDADGGSKQLTGGDGERRPRFASDGRFVFFQKGFGNVLSSIWKVSIDAGGDPQQLTRTHQTYPDVSPDGQRLVYSFMDTSATDAGQWRLGIAGVEDGKQLASFALPASVTNRLTRWTPDGQVLIFISTVGGVSNLWLQPADGSRARQITDFSAQEIEAFDLARGGRGLAVVRTHRASDAVLLSDTR